MRMKRFRLSFGIFTAVLSTAMAQAPAKKPNVPPGTPTRGFAVALISAGIDYTKPTIAARLARDGEGDIVAWDAVDKDRKPFLATSAANPLVELSPALVAPIRIDVADAASWTEAFAFIARSPARVAVVAVPITDSVLRTVAWPRMAALADVLFIVPAGDDNRDLDTSQPAVLQPAKASNIVVVSALARRSNPTAQPNRGGRTVDLVLVPASAAREAPSLANPRPATSMEAAILTVGLFACVDVRAAKSPAEVKQTFIAKAARATAEASPIIEICS
jgi:hypothetical protein